MARKHDINVNITGTDNVSSVFANVRTNASSMASSLTKSLGNSIGYIEGLNKAVRSYNNEMYKFNRVATNVFRTAGDSIYNFTKDAINNFSELERQHAKTMGAMATGYDKTAEAQAKFFADSQKLQQQAINLGTHGVNGKGSLNSAMDVAYAQTALVKAGVIKDNNVDQFIKSGAVESILKFAGGNDLDIDTATQFAVNLGTVFNKPIEQWGEMLDQVTKAADISVIDVEDIMDSLTYTGGIASGLGRELTEVLGIISVMGQAGLRGRVAGTGLQAFFTRILSAGELSDTQIGNAPTEYVGQMYNAFVAESVNSDGSFKNMDEVAELLDTAMGSLNDQEQAWFAKKLFGLYQMKAAYAITGAVDEDANLITDFINRIENESSGTNIAKYELMQASQYGKLTSLSNAWEGIKTDMGDRMSPIVSAVADELLAFLSNNGNYDINWDTLRDAINESGELIGEKYGQDLGTFVANLGNTGIDAGMIAGAVAPTAGGIISGIGKLLQGDISGALDDFSDGLETTNDNIEDLPPELRGVASTARNVIVAFTALSGVNLAAQVLQVFTTLGSTISKMFSKPSVNTSVSSTNSNINITTANYINIGSVDLMNVTANVVNVYGGGGGNNPTNPSNPTTPQLPGGTPTITPQLPGGAPVITPIPTLPSGSPTLALPGAGAGANPPGSYTNLYKVGGNYYTAKQIAGAIAKKAGLIGLAVATAGLTASDGLFSSADTRRSQGDDWLDKYVAEGNTNYSSIANNARVYDWVKNQSGFNGNNSADIVEAEMRGRTSAREEMMSYYKSTDGSQFLHDLLTKQIEENGKITEDFLTAIMTWDKDGYTYTGVNEDIKEILKFMYDNFDKDYKDSLYYNDRFNESAIDKFLKDGPNTNVFSEHSVDEVYNLNKLTELLRNNQNINVNVTNNIDKNGNVTTKVDVDSVNKAVSRQASRYGSGARFDMMN